MKLPTWIVASAIALSLTLATGCSIEQSSGGLLGMPADAPPPSLGDGPLRQIATHGETDPDDDTSSLNADGVLETDDLIVVLTQPDNSLAAYAQESAEEVWRVELPRDETTETGACFEPKLAAPDLVAVFIGTGCPLLATYDLATGELRHQERVIEEYILGDCSKQTDPSSGGYPFEASVQGAVELDARLWFLTHGFLGYVDDDGSPVPVLDSADLGLRDSLRLADRILGPAERAERRGVPLRHRGRHPHRPLQLPVPRCAVDGGSNNDALAPGSPVPSGPASPAPGS